MTFKEVLAQAIDWLQQDKRLSYRALQRQFDLDNDYLDDLKAELTEVRRVAVDEDGRVLVWTGDTSPVSATPVVLTVPGALGPLTYTPSHLAEKILTFRSALEGERKQVTVLFADLKGSMELLADRDPEEARQLLDPVLERMMEAVHRYEGTVNQVMGDGIMALFGAPIAHEDHAVRACYAALAMHAAIRAYAEDVRRTQDTARVYDQGLALCRASGNRNLLRLIAVGLGSAYTLQGRLAEGYTLLEEAISECIRMGALQGHAYRVAWLSEVCRLMGRSEETWQHAHQALDLARQQKARGDEALALPQLATVLAHVDPPDVVQAESYYQQALALAKELGMRPLQAHCHHELGRLYGQTGQREQARIALSTTITMYRAMDMTFWLPQAEAALAQIE